MNGPHALSIIKRQIYTVTASEQCGAMTEAASGPGEADKGDSVQEKKTKISFLTAIKPPRGGNGVIQEPLSRKNLCPRMS